MPLVPKAGAPQANVRRLPVASRVQAVIQATNGARWFYLVVAVLFGLFFSKIDAVIAALDDGIAKIAA